MTKEQLERIKQAYYSGLKIQIWFDGYWEDFDIRDYSMYPDPFSENRQYRIVGSEYADIAEKRIAELEAYNEKLLNSDIEKHNKIVELEKELADYRKALNQKGQACFRVLDKLAKREEQIEALNKDKDYFSDALDKQIEATLKVVEVLNKAKEIIKKFLNAKSIEDTCVAESEAEQFLKED